MGQQQGPQPVTQQVSSEDRAARFTTLINLIETHAPQEQIFQAQQAVAESIGGDQFQVIQMLPQFMQAAKKMLDAATVYEHFRLPGRERIVHDNREGGKPEKAEGKESARGGALELEIQDGKVVKQKEKSYENYLGDRMGQSVMVEHEEAGARIGRLLSAFEQMVVARFEGGREVATESADGKAKFLAKTEAQWKEFFSKFIDRIVAKKISAEDIREFLFRGVIPKGNKGIVISDMVLNDGRIEKFIRFSVIADALARLRAMTPGDVIGREKLAGMLGEEFLYLALAVARGKDMATSPLPAAGKFMLGSTEEKAAQELGIAIGGQQAGKGAHVRGRGRRSPFTGLFDDREGEPEDLPYQFIPWWHWSNLKRPTKSRWATIVFYISLLAISLMGIGVLTYRLLSGGL